MSTSVAGVATLIFNLSTVNFENSILRPNGNLLLTTITNGSLYEINPLAANPQASLVATFGGASVLGIDSIGYDKYAIAGGIAGEGMSAYTNESIYTIDLSTDSTTAVPTVAATIPDAQLLDGLVALPRNPSILLVTDALQGVIYRVDLRNGTSTIAVQDDALSGSPGVNGIKILGDYAHFTNTATETYGKFRITPDGQQAGNIEIIATDAASDDFALAKNGVAYLGSQSSPIEIVSVTANGTKTTVATNESMGRPCSLDLTEDGNEGYVTTASGEVYRFAVPVAGARRG